MDEMKIESKVLRGVVSRYIAKQIKKKLGCDAWVELGEFKIEMDEEASEHLIIDAGCKRAQVAKLLDKVL